MDFIQNLIERLSSRSFVVAVAVIYFIATHPEITVEQLVGLLVGTGIVTARAVAEDKVVREHADVPDEVVEWLK